MGVMEFYEGVRQKKNVTHNNNTPLQIIKSILICQQPWNIVALEIFELTEINYIL